MVSHSRRVQAKVYHLGILRIEHLIADIDEAVYEKIMSNRTVEETEARDTAKIVGLAALKYGDLSNQASKDYVFDIERFSSFEGNTGPYILYTIVRIKSILNKYTENLFNYETLKKMKSSAVLLNLGRGLIVNDADLVLGRNI